jgi:hypothetical protein
VLGRLPLSDTARRVVRVYREQAGFLIRVALLVFVPLGLVESVAERYEEFESEEVRGSELAAALSAVFVHTVSGSLGEEFYAGVVMAVVAQSMVGKERPPLRTVMRTTPYLRLIATSLLFSLGLGLGLALFVIPGAVFFAWFVLAAPLVKIEGLGVRAAFRRSRQLERGSFWPVLLLVGSVYLLSEGLTTALQESGGGFLGHSLAADWAVAVVVSVAVLPLWAVAVDVTAWRLVQMEGSPASR